MIFPEESGPSMLASCLDGIMCIFKVPPTSLLFFFCHSLRDWGHGQRRQILLQIWEQPQAAEKSDFFKKLGDLKPHDKKEHL